MKGLRAIVVGGGVKIQNSSKKLKYGEVFYPSDSDIMKVFLTSLP